MQLKDRRLTESYFENGALRQSAEYPYSLQFPMTRRADGLFLCATAYNVPLWIGAEADQPRDFERLINEGAALGELADHTGEVCRIIGRRSGERADYFFINGRQLVSEWWMITDCPDRVRDRFLWRVRFTFHTLE